MWCELNVSHTIDCISPGQRRWPEDLAWHPVDETLFAVYTADGGPQIGIIKTCKTESSTRYIIITQDLGMVNFYVLYSCWMFFLGSLSVPHFHAKTWG
jgi:hypothetical protein